MFCSKYDILNNCATASVLFQEKKRQQVFLVQTFDCEHECGEESERESKHMHAAIARRPGKLALITQRCIQTKQAKLYVYIHSLSLALLHCSLVRFLCHCAGANYAIRQGTPTKEWRLSIYTLFPPAEHKNCTKCGIAMRKIQPLANCLSLLTRAGANKH